MIMCINDKLAYLPEIRNSDSEKDKKLLSTTKCTTVKCFRRQVSVHCLLSSHKKTGKGQQNITKICYQ